MCAGRGTPRPRSRPRTGGVRCGRPGRAMWGHLGEAMPRQVCRKRRNKNIFHTNTVYDSSRQIIVHVVFFLCKALAIHEGKPLHNINSGSGQGRHVKSHLLPERVIKRRFRNAPLRQDNRSRRAVPGRASGIRQRRIKRCIGTQSSTGLRCASLGDEPGKYEMPRS